MRIEDRVFDAITYFSLREFARGLNAICPAIEATARKSVSKQKITKDEFKNFVRQYYWIIERFSGCPDLDLTRFPSQIMRIENDKVLREPDFADIVYHFFRCALAHGHDIPEGFEFLPSHDPSFAYWSISADGGILRMPEQIAWALVAIVIFPNANSDLSTKSASFLTWQGEPGGHKYTFDVDVFWGREDLLRPLFEKFGIIRVHMKS